MLLGAKADGKGATGGNQRRGRVAQPDTKTEADRHGENKDGVGAKGLGLPIEDEAIREKRGSGRRDG